MSQQPLSSKPFQVARPAPFDEVILARAYALLGRSKKLLQQGPPSTFLGDQRYGPVQLAGETERAPKVDQIILSDQQLRDLTRQSIEQRIVWDR